MTPETQSANGAARRRDAARPVWITGVGVVSPLGNAPATLWQNLRSGTSGVSELSQLPLEAYRTRIGGAVRDFQPRQFISDPKSLKLMTRPVRLGVAAMELAVHDAGLTPEVIKQLDPARIASFVGSPGHAGDRDELLPALDASWSDAGLDLGAFGSAGIPTINPLWLLKSLANLVLYFVSLRLGAQGPNANICMSGAGGSMAVGEAFHALRYGRADIAVAGGYESLLDEERLESFEPSGLLYLGPGPAAAASRPFDRGRRGFVAAEGGAFVVLEAADHARARGARPYAELRGYGSASGGGGSESEARAQEIAAFTGAMEAALSDARCEAWDVDAIYAQGLGTDASDRAEAEAMKQLLTARAAYTPVTAVKSFTGNLLAASGPLELIAALDAFNVALNPAGGALPPILNCEHPDPDLGLDYVRGAARTGQFRRVLLNASGLGGAVASLLIERLPENEVRA